MNGLTRSRIASVVLSVAACGMTIAGCSITDSTAATEDSPTSTTSDRGAQPQLDRHARLYRDALFDQGIPRSQSDSTTLLLAQGICKQLSAGTPEPAILENLRSLADYTATQSQGALTGDRVARLYLDTAKSTYCKN